MLAVAKAYSPKTTLVSKDSYKNDGPAVIKMNKINNLQRRGVKLQKHLFFYTLQYSYDVGTTMELPTITPASWNRAHVTHYQ